MDGKMEFVGFVLLFSPMSEKKVIINLLKDYGFANILDGWSGKNNLPKQSFCIRVPKEQHEKWLQIFYEEPQISGIEIVVESQKKK